MTPAQKFRANKHERDVQRRMIELEAEPRDGYANDTKKANLEAVRRLIAAGIREAVETTTDAEGRVEIRHRLVRI